MVFVDNYMCRSVYRYTGRYRSKNSAIEFKSSVYTINAVNSFSTRNTTKIFSDHFIASTGN